MRRHSFFGYFALDDHCVQHTNWLRSFHYTAVSVIASRARMFCIDNSVNNGQAKLNVKVVVAEEGV